MKYKLKTGDNLQILKNLPDNSIDAIITDPPYGLSFMNKKWDYEVPSVELWKEVLRVLKPGGHLLSFGGTRTYHRLVVNIEDAGFEIRDQIQWIYGSGFPKSHNIGKAIDAISKTGKSNPKALREVRMGDEYEPTGQVDYKKGRMFSSEITNDFTDQTIHNDYKGWGTALKPANEPICLARKPISEKSVAENVIKWRTGGINIDKSRIGSDTQTEGRFPANIILECCCDEVIAGEKGEPFSYVGKEYNNKDLEDGRSIDFLEGSKSEGPSNYNDKADIHTNPLCTCYILDEQSGYLKSGEVKPHHKKNKQTWKFYVEETANGQNTDTTLKGYGDGGGASRFFYVAKVSKKERNMGLDGFEEKENKMTNMYSDKEDGTPRKGGVQKNTHPTVKPINLMTYLCNLITPEGGTILDPFMGSGSTGIAALLQGYNFLGIDMDPEYTKIAEGRISNYEKYRDLLKE